MRNFVSSITVFLTEPSLDSILLNVAGLAMSQYVAFLVLSHELRPRPCTCCIQLQQHAKIIDDDLIFRSEEYFVYTVRYNDANAKRI